MSQMQGKTSGLSGAGRRTFTHNGLRLECFFADNGRLSRKIEYWGGSSADFTYQYDARGRLLKVTRNGAFAESYVYNDAGQRIEQSRKNIDFSESSVGSLYYDVSGRLERAGDMYFAYEANGTLARRGDNQGSTQFVYGKDSFLDEVTFPSRVKVRYEYGAAKAPANGGPRSLVLARRIKGGSLAAEYQWHDVQRLAAYRDHEHELDYAFFYDQSGRLDKIRISPLSADQVWKRPPDAPLRTDWLADYVTENRKIHLHTLIAGYGGVLDLRCGTDQVGTLKVLTDANGRLFKEIHRDSFGVHRYDSLPELFIPIGFAGGLEDPDTGLVRFGYRDYDPLVGRFTAPDPARDLRGDADLYDYCADDPVNRTDPTGLVGLDTVAKFFLKQIGSNAVKSYLGDTLNAPEEMTDVRKTIIEKEEKIQSKKATKKDFKELEKARTREDELWGEYGKHYIDSEFFRRYFPDDDYASKKKQEADHRKRYRTMPPSDYLI